MTALTERPDGSWVSSPSPLRESLPDSVRMEFDRHTLEVWRRLGNVHTAQGALARFLHARDVVDTEEASPLLQDLANEREALYRAVCDLLSFSLQGGSR